jgi:hypothetical protein
MAMSALKPQHGCKSACLATAGRGKFSNVVAARMRKTRMFFEEKALFLETLNSDLVLFSKYCKDNSIKGYVRLNGTSDISWEKYGIFPKFPELQFYDYTKVHNRKVSSYSNYQLTYSRSEDSDDQSLLKALNNNMNIAVVFEELPVVWKIGTKVVPVVNGDLNDLRPEDPSQVIVGLTAKGLAKKDKSGFVVLKDKIC